MANEEKAKRSEESGSKRFPVEGKAARVLSTSLGVALLANAFLIPGATAAGASANTSGDQTAADEPILVSWSTEEVKQYFDKNTDWNIPLKEQPEEDQEGQSASAGSGTTGGTTVINNYGSVHSGFGWDDLLLYHMLFNSGSSYSTTNYYNGRPTYYTGTSQTYKPRTYTSGTFQNKQVVGSTVRPKTSTSTGSITRRGTSSSSGSIGGKSSGFSSSSSSSHSSSKSGGFGG
ncbi:hypothetical protein [Paenibacillus sp. XY044]|uniref:hypothetical protein n=1 Tax=Paenibacillus sp. XY044 TaxID=2026089 RepID=UPI000B99A0D5|nr:hypothetical protein [Paenibacillus sp. XY044]OZB93000.1 hypothetical protein CJP46_24275 [Paenibacillus sp. XY044]